MQKHNKRIEAVVLDAMFHELGNALVPILHLKSKVLNDGHHPSQSDLYSLFKRCGQIEQTLDTLRTLAKNNFKGATFRTDCSGFISKLILE